MILKLFRPTPPDDTIARLYGTIVAQARTPAFYQLYGVPDTVSGRLEMIILHVVLLLRQLEGQAGPPSPRLGRDHSKRSSGTWRPAYARRGWVLLAGPDPPAE